MEFFGKSAKLKPTRATQYPCVRDFARRLSVNFFVQLSFTKNVLINFKPLIYTRTMRTSMLFTKFNNGASVISRLY